MKQIPRNTSEMFKAMNRHDDMLRRWREATHARGIESEDYIVDLCNGSGDIQLDSWCEVIEYDEEDGQFLLRIDTAEAWVPAHQCETIKNLNDE